MVANNTNLKILFVDDSNTVLDMVESNLLELGYLNIKSATNGVEALMMCEQDEFDFIITDINMPEMDGLTLIKRLREKLDYAATPIMVLSTEWTKAMKQKGKEAGATSWIVKPFNKELIAKGIKETINRVNSED
jgi:two-component system chemotaxis response regulator CheY